MNASDKAIELGAEKIDGGINWTWAISFPNRRIAEEFVRWLEENGYEHRGVYPDEDSTSCSVRYR